MLRGSTQGMTTPVQSRSVPEGVLMELERKRVTVVGIGVTGKAASILLRRKGTLVYATDSGCSDELKAAAQELKKLGVFVEIGKHTEAFIRGSDLVVVSPGVTDSSPAIVMANTNSIPIVSEIELASWFCRAPMIAVTGTNGKSTVVTLIGLMLKASGKNPVVCGNIGEAFCNMVDDISSEDIAVVEVSSFQLKRIRNLRPRVAAITNIAQNHFDWHADFREYLECKMNIYKNQKEDDFTILNYDDPRLKNLERDLCSQAYFFSIYDEVKGAYFYGNHIILNMGTQEFSVCRADDIRLKGEHNISNILCACVCAYILGADPDAMKKILFEFEGLDHRFQDVATINGIRFIDDSKATTVDAARAALTSCSEKVILIAGGRDKGSDFSKIKELIAEKTKAVILMGEAKSKIREGLKGAAEIYDARDMDEAVSISQDLAKRGDIVLLSPMCASFDMYRDYKHRGETFRNAVSKLRNSIRTQII